MRISRLELRDFRNYSYWGIEPDSALSIFVGPNAVGKTNIIEAIQLVSTGGSFRNAHWSDLVRFGANSAEVSMTADGEGSHADVRLKLDHLGSRTWSVGEVVKRRPRDATRFVPVVAFTPDDLTLVKGSAEHRRNTLDALGEQLSNTYGALRRDYTKVVRQRNVLLKDDAPAASLEPWDEQLAVLGARLHVHRRGLAARLLDAAGPIYAHLSLGEVLDMRMCDRCGVNDGDLQLDLSADEVARRITQEITRRRGEEAKRKMSLVGPHRDDITFLIDGREARAFGSQGQQRTIALAWKWAEVSVVSKVLGRDPVLLLDDVMSELDQSRRAALTDLVQRDIQTFITTTTTNYFDPALLRQARVVTIGRVE